MRLRTLIGVMPRRAAAVALAVACTAAAACGPETSEGGAPPSGTIAVTDGAGRSVVLPGPAHRIVSLVPSATETLRAIGADDAVVGRTDFDAQEWASDLPSVGGGLEPNLEAIVALEPDLVIRFGGSQDPRTPSRLDELGIPHLAVRPDLIEDIYRTTELLGAVTGHQERADSLLRTIRDGLRDLSQRTAGLPRLRVAYVLGGTPPWVAGPDTYIDQVVSLAGGENVFSDLGALYSSVSPEQLLTRDIDVVLLSGAATFDGALAPGARVVPIGDVLEIPGPGVVSAAHLVAEMLHGRSLR